MKYIAYYRITKDTEAERILELEAQKAQVHLTVERMGGSVVTEYVDEESGKSKSNKRLYFTRALTQARRTGAPIVVASLDRLSYNVGFITSLMESDVTFIASERVSPTRTVTHLFAALVEEDDNSVLDLVPDPRQASKVPSRVRNAIQSLRPQNLRPGSPYNLTAVAQRKGAEALKQKAIDNEANRRSTAFAIKLKRAGKNLTEIASQLNTEGYTTSTGKQFQPVQVQRLLQRADESLKANKVQGGLFETNNTRRNSPN